MNSRALSRKLEEKRDFMRLAVNTPVYLMIDTSRVPLEGTCKNLSSTGMLLELSQPLALGTQCAAFIQTGSTDRPPLEASIEIIRQEPAPNHRFLIGAKIIQMS